MPQIPMSAPLVQTATVPPMVPQQPLVQPVNSMPQTGIIQPLPQTYPASVPMRPPQPAPIVPGLVNTQQPVAQPLVGQTFPINNSQQPTGFGSPLIPTAPVGASVGPTASMAATVPVVPTAAAVPGTVFCH